jgi:hypothetical protein
MKFPEHLTLSFLIAQFGVQQQYGLAGTALVILAGNLPDLDSVTIVGGWRFYRTHHRIIGHGLPVTLFGPLLLAGLGFYVGLGSFWLLWFWLQIALIAHLTADVCFYRWPVQLLWPLSRRGWGLGLVGWHDLVPTLTLYSATLLALLWHTQAVLFASLGISALVLYLTWRACRPSPPQLGGTTWLTGGWAEESSRIWRWAIGDFIT